MTSQDSRAEKERLSVGPLRNNKSLIMVLLKSKVNICYRKAGLRVRSHVLSVAREPLTQSRLSSLFLLSVF